MTFQVNETLPLGRFNFDPDWTPVLGTYIVPLVFFAADRSNDPNDYLVVERVATVKNSDVAITRGGGLYVRDCGQYNDPESRQKLANLLNIVLAEMAFQGLVSEPVTNLDIQTGHLIGRHVSIPGGWGSHAIRTWGPHWLLAPVPRELADNYPGYGNATCWPPNAFWMPHDPSILQRIDGMSASLRLDEISSSLPTLLVAAVYHASRHNFAESILSSWIVAEEILSYVWDQYVASVTSSARQKRLEDSRTYTAAVRAEILHSIGTLDETIYDLLSAARKARNELAHRALVRQEAASTCIDTMRAMLQRIGLETERLPAYPHTFGGSGQPRNALEPSVEFR
jgi:hypothetical protein